MQRYREISENVFGVFHEITPLVQGLSLDEAFLDVTESQALLGEPAAIARRIKDDIRARTGLTASVGVATNKLVAKIASDLDKPDGLTFVPESRIREVLDPLSVRRLPGLGRKLGERVEAAGLRTLGELRTATDAVLWPLFGRDSRADARAGGRHRRPSGAAGPGGEVAERRGYLCAGPRRSAPAGRAALAGWRTLPASGCAAGA